MHWISVGVSQQVKKEKRCCVLTKDLTHQINNLMLCVLCVNYDIVNAFVEKCMMSEVYNMDMNSMLKKTFGKNS